MSGLSFTTRAVAVLLLIGTSATLGLLVFGVESVTRPQMGVLAALDLFGGGLLLRDLMEDW